MGQLCVPVTSITALVCKDTPPPNYDVDIPKLLFVWSHDISPCEVGQVLDNLCNQGEGPRGTVVRVLLHEVKEARRHDGWAEETEEERGTDQALADVLLPPVEALLLPRCKHLLQLPRKDTRRGKSLK